MSDMTATTQVTVELTDRRATIADIQYALDTFAREGIPDTFEIRVHQWQDRDDSDKEIPYADRPVKHRLTIEASRAAL